MLGNEYRKRNQFKLLIDINNFIIIVIKDTIEIIIILYSS